MCQKVKEKCHILFIYYIIFTQEYPISAQHCSPWGSYYYTKKQKTSLAVPVVALPYQQLKMGITIRLLHRRTSLEFWTGKKWLIHHELIRHDGFVTFPFLVKRGWKTCCYDANLLHVHNMSRPSHVCNQRLLSGQLVSPIYNYVEQELVTTHF